MPGSVAFPSVWVTYNFTLWFCGSESDHQQVFLSRAVGVRNPGTWHCRGQISVKAGASLQDRAPCEWAHSPLGLGLRRSQKGSGKAHVLRVCWNVRRLQGPLPVHLFWVSTGCQCRHLTFLKSRGSERPAAAPHPWVLEAGWPEGPIVCALGWEILQTPFCCCLSLLLLRQRTPYLSRHSGAGCCRPP